MCSRILNVSMNLKDAEPELTFLLVLRSRIFHYIVYFHGWIVRNALIAARIRGQINKEPELLLKFKG